MKLEKRFRARLSLSNPYLKEPLKNCRFAQQSFKKSGRKFQYLAIFSSKQPVFLEN